MSRTDMVAFMRDIEERYKSVSGLTTRADYKIFYGLVRPAPTLVLGINPAGSPANMEPNGAKEKTGGVAAASDSFYENDECDLLDCTWKENAGLKKLLVPLLDGNEEAIRHSVVKTNVAFRRSPTPADIDIEGAKWEAAPFLLELMAAVRPRLILLTSVNLTEFLKRFCKERRMLTAPIKDDAVKQVVFESASARLRKCDTRSLVVRVAHASRYSATYAKYNVVERIQSALAAQ